MKKEFRERYFNCDEFLRTVLNEYFTDKDKINFFKGIEKLIQKCKKCLDVGGDYIEISNYLSLSVSIPRI